MIPVTREALSLHQRRRCTSHIRQQCNADACRFPSSVLVPPLLPLIQIMAKSEDQPAPDCSKPSNACIWFLDNLELYRTEKPYDLDYEPEDDDVPSTNFVRTAHDVHVKDLRDGQGKCLSYESCGFAVLGMKSQLTIKDCDETQKLQDLYLHNLQQKLCEFYGTPHVVKFGHKVS